MCVDLLDEMDITVNGKSKLKQRGYCSLSLLWPTIHTLKETPKVFKSYFSDEDLLNYFNAYLHTNFKANSLKYSGKKFETTKKNTRRYLVNAGYIKKV